MILVMEKGFASRITSHIMNARLFKTALGCWFSFQKFRFCGEGDCPDWVLAEIHSNLAVLSSEQLQEVAHHVARCIVGEDVPVSLSV